MGGRHEPCGRPASMLLMLDICPSILTANKRKDFTILMSMAGIFNKEISYNRPSCQVLSNTSATSRKTMVECSLLFPVDAYIIKNFDKLQRGGVLRSECKLYGSYFLCIVDSFYDNYFHKSWIRMRVKQLADGFQVFCDLYPTLVCE